MIIYFFSGHCEGNEVSDHARIHFQPMFVGEVGNDSLYGFKGDEGYLFCIAFFDLLLQVFSVSADQVHEFLVLGRMTEEGD